jgi:RNA polymerase sigma factor (TIGR02999 family)
MGEDLPAIGEQPTRAVFQAVYDELRRLASKELTAERANHSLNPTALVHEAFLSLAGKDDAKLWASSRAFYVAAAEAMRHILVDHARYHLRLKRGGDRQRVFLPLEDVPATDYSDVLAISEALEVLAGVRPEAAELVKLRYFAGLTLDEAAALLGLKPTTADRRWAFAKAWLYDRLGGPGKEP